LCEGTNHVLADCHLNAIVDKMNQQVKQKIHPSLGTASAEFEPKGSEYFVTTQRDNPRVRLQNNYRKRERFPTVVMEYEKQELEDLLAMEKPKKKKDISQVECRECKRLGHYAWNCPDKKKRKESENRDHETNEEQKRDCTQVNCFNCRESGHFANHCPEKLKGRDVSLVTCFKCGVKGHYANTCPKRNSERQGQLKDNTVVDTVTQG
jgi:hypothetical protein